MAAMQFWGVEVKGKEPLKVRVAEGNIIHISQATLGEVKKDNEPVMLSVKIGAQKLVLGVLSTDKSPQLSFDLVFEKDFEISHNWKNGSVHLLGYQSELADEDYSDFSGDEEEMPVPVPMKMNGKAPAIKDKKAKVEEDEDDSDDDDEDDSGSDSDGGLDGLSTDGTSVDGSDDDDEDEEDSDDDDESDDSEDESEEEETPKPASSGKKRPNKPEAKTPESKKAKLATPQKTDGKKGAPHTATPYPNKKGGKTPTADKSPASGGKVACGSCTKSFNTDKALDSHKKAKHGGK